ncbi:hypothetical protein FOXG_16026 [Fusarium oxysporum f. sp. lycopersici 4287]|uniref:Uncharacterized protein n=2 Tax=Fusarium oxysporum TaxID=5507 RepID=A0A0J9W5L2_FUSO4|nr:hypothetical protein FOXG_15567 [Fusarium oxysporum f. sp. lycopersici 4287]XP_018256384.1 uncharacterized protein FOXG_16026 [Fusarium oxysporum f. sp. lycopersici 4287]KNB17825.1 hypothetical protein FOXG_15567 [Fusarium oxysporum f. sp. lycopersici 4287]KNB18339.1 hypothetical protein FOXG_16026 [Fusarium oxysporum f. sp. lycopersici 4287]
MDTAGSASDSCGIDGNPDLYGLGIRISFYLQLITYLCTMYHVVRNDILEDGPAFRFMSQVRAAFIAYALSVFVILVRETVRRTLYAVEVSIVIYLVVPYLSMVTVDRRWRKDNPVGYRFALGLFVGFECYLVWFLFAGMDKLHRVSCADDYIFFFARVNLFGWFRTLLKVMTVPLGVYYTAKFLFRRVPCLPSGMLK